jgi:hypothetical protein
VLTIIEACADECADVATFCGWLDQDTCAGVEVRLWDDDEVLAALVPTQRDVADAV